MGELVPSGGGHVDRTVLNILTGDQGVRPRDVDVSVGDKLDHYNSRKLSKKLPVKRKEPEAETECSVEPDR